MAPILGNVSFLVISSGASEGPPMEKPSPVNFNFAKRDYAEERHGSLRQESPRNYNIK